MSPPYQIPFSRVCLEGHEVAYTQQSLTSGYCAANGRFTAQARARIAAFIGHDRVLLTSSCSDALEMAMLLAEVGPGDEVILPSFTFTSTANAVALRGAKPVFADVDRDLLLLDLADVKRRVTPRTKAVISVHYAGMPGNAAEMRAFCDAAGLVFVEDAAQSYFSRTADGTPVGTHGHLSCVSFHETKTFTCGEGGALIVNDPAYHLRAECLLEKGTNRLRFMRGEIDKYTWCDVGSSFPMSDVTAAFLLAQLETTETIVAKRRAVWEFYARHLTEALEARGYQVNRVQAGVTPNYHMFWLLAPDAAQRAQLLAHMRGRGILATSHYEPLHLSPYYREAFGASPALPVTEDIAPRLVRLPLFNSLTEELCRMVVDAVLAFASA